MALLVNNSPRCGSKKIAFNVSGSNYLGQVNYRHTFELFCICAACLSSTVFMVGLEDQNSLSLFKGQGFGKNDLVANHYCKVIRFVSVIDQQYDKVPEFLPNDIEPSFKEAVTCLSVGCHNAAGAMFRLCVDLATRPLLPEPDMINDPAVKLDSRQRRDLGLRLPWLFENRRLDPGLRDLVACIREDGNDGAHAGTLTKEDAEDLLDFTTELLERLYTQPRRLELAQERRERRRGS